MHRGRNKYKALKKEWIGNALYVLFLGFLMPSLTDAQTLCDHMPGDIIIDAQEQQKNSNYQTRYFLVEKLSGNILQYSDSLLFMEVDAGNYDIYGVNFRSLFGIENASIGDDFFTLNGECVDTSAPLSISVCYPIEIDNFDIDTIPYCEFDSLFIFPESVEITHLDNEEIFLEISIIDGGDGTEVLDVDLQNFPKWGRSFNYPTLRISFVVKEELTNDLVNQMESLAQQIVLVTEHKIGDTMTLSYQVSDDFGNSETHHLVIIHQECEAPCPPIGLDSLFVIADNCTEPFYYPLNIRISQVEEFDIMVNSEVVATDVIVVATDTVILYDLSLIAQNTGPFVIDNWQLDGLPYSGRVSNIEDIRNLFNQWSGTDQWILEGNFLKSADDGASYGSLAMSSETSTTTWNFQANRIIAPNGFAALALPEGSHFIEIENKSIDCYRSGYLSFRCFDPFIQNRLILQTIDKGAEDTLCLSAVLNESVIIVDTDCTMDSLQNTTFRVEDHCVIYAGESIGRDTLCLNICNNENRCDSIQLVISVLEVADRPIAYNDTIGTTATIPIDIEVLSNDSLFNVDLEDLELLSNSNFGTLILNADNSIGYEAIEKYCGKVDTFLYAITTSGGRDTATVYVEIACDDILVMNGFSPNGDGVNDTFVIKGLETIPDNRVEIFNRWGNRIYSVRNYDNNDGWDGTFLSDLVPDGTYFYTIQDDKRKVVKAGWVQVFK